MNLTTDRIKTIEDRLFTASLREDNIIHVHIKAETSITIRVQQRMEVAYNQLTDSPVPFIFTAGAFISITKAARENAIKMEDKVPVSSSALIVSNLAHRILANFYYKVNRPQKPLKVFNDFETGIMWLKSIQLEK